MRCKQAPQSRAILKIFLGVVAGIAVLFAINGCGVKGDPVPPDRPSELGRGRPTYKRATEKFKLKEYQPTEKDWQEPAAPNSKDKDSSDEDN